MKKILLTCVLAVGCLAVLAVAYPSLSISESQEAAGRNAEWSFGCGYTDCYGEYGSCMDDCDDSYPVGSAAYNNCANSCNVDLYDCEMSQLWCPHEDWWSDGWR